MSFTPPIDPTIEIPYLLVKDYFTEAELDMIWKELDHLNRPGVFDPPGNTGSATYEGEIIKSNSGVFIDKVYTHPKYSAIFQCNHKIFDGYTAQYWDLSFYNRGILQTNASDHLISYYENSDHYKPHNDQAVATALHWLWKEPKKFEGGELTFSDTGETIPLTNNTMLLFPSYAMHEVSPVIMAPEDMGKGLGRYCISIFMYNTAEAAKF
jgi:hypothetical protein